MNTALRAKSTYKTIWLHPESKNCISLIISSLGNMISGTLLLCDLTYCRELDGLRLLHAKVSFVV